MHVWILAGLPLASSAYSEHKAHVAAPFLQLVRVGVVEVHETCGTKERTGRQRCNLFAQDLLSGVGLACLHSQLIWQCASHAMPRLGASLRAPLAHFLAKANALHGKCLSTSGATRQSSNRILYFTVKTKKVDYYSIDVSFLHTSALASHSPAARTLPAPQRTSLQRPHRPSPFATVLSPVYLFDLLHNSELGFAGYSTYMMAQVARSAF